MRLRNPPDLQRVLVLPLSPCTDPETRDGRLARVPLLSCLLLLCVFAVVIAKGAGLLPVLGLGVLLIGATARFLLSHDYHYALRVDRGRMHILRNGVPIFDCSVLGGAEQRPTPKLLIGDGRVEAVRCRPGEPPSYVFGVPILRIGNEDRARLRQRLAAEVQALDTVPRQLELLDDPDVQAHLLARLSAAGQERPSALHAELLRLAQGSSSRSALAQALLFRSLGARSQKSLPH